MKFIYVIIFIWLKFLLLDFNSYNYEYYDYDTEVKNTKKQTIYYINQPTTSRKPAIKDHNDFEEYKLSYDDTGDNYNYYYEDYAGELNDENDGLYEEVKETTKRPNNKDRSEENSGEELDARNLKKLKNYLLSYYERNTSVKALGSSRLIVFYISVFLFYLCWCSKKLICLFFFCCH